MFTILPRHFEHPQNIIDECCDLYFCYAFGWGSQRDCTNLKISTTNFKIKISNLYKLVNGFVKPPNWTETVASLHHQIEIFAMALVAAEVIKEEERTEKEEENASNGSING